jgi:cupin superfamily acireductone dioxygenase involved in methionine salvage
MKYYDTYDFSGIGYEKLFHHQNWRLANLNYIEELEVEKLNYVEAHDLTDEVFVLLSGTCHMFFAEVENERIKDISCISLEQNKVYKIPMGVYHTHTLSADAKLLIVEEESTSYENSPRVYMTNEEKDIMKKRYREQSR